MAGEDLGAIRGKIEIEYDDRGVGRAKSDIDGLVGNAERSTGAIAGFFGGMTAGIVETIGSLVVEAGQQLASLAIDGLKSFASFETGMNEVFTLLPGISEDAMSQMTQQVLDTANQMEVLPEEVVPALYSSLSAGIPPGNVFDFLLTANKLAQGGVTDLDTAVTAISGTVNAYGSEVVSADQVSDALFTAVRTGATTIDELGASLSNVVPTAAGLGVGIDQVTAAISTMTAQGVPTTQATTQLRQLFVELSKAGGEAAGTFEEMSGKTFREFVASGGNVQEALQLMEQAAANDGVALTDLFGSVEAGNAALFLTGSATDTFTSNLAAQQEAAGATDAAFEQMQAGITDAWDQMRVAIDVFIKKALLVVGPMIENFTRNAIAAFEWLQTTGFDWFRAEAVPVIQELGRILFDYLGPGISAMAAIVVGAFNFMRTDGFDILRNNVIPTIREVIEFFDRFQTPIKIIAALIGTVLIPHFVALGIAALVNAVKTVVAWTLMQVAAVRAAFVHSAQVALMISRWAALAAVSLVQAARVVASWVLMGAGAIANAARVAVAWVITNVGAIASVGIMAVAVARFIAGWVLMGTQALIQAARVALAWLIAMGPIGLIIAAVIALVALIIANWDAIWTFTKMIWEAIWNFLKGIWDFIVGAITAYIQLYISIIRAGLNFIKAVWEAVWNAVKSFFIALWNGLKTAISTYINFYKTIISAGLNFIKAYWTTVWNAVRTVVTTVINAIRAVVQSGVDRVKGIIRGVSAIVDTVRNAFNSAKNAASDRISALLSLVSGLPGRIISALGNMASKLYGAGGDLIRGLINGIRAMAGNAASAAVDAVRGAIDAATGFLGIGSPSKLARDVIGGPIMQGVAWGETKNADLPRDALVRALSTLPKAVAPTVNAVVSGQSGGSQAYTFGPGSLVLDVSKLKSIDDVIKAVEGLKPTSRQFVNVRT